MNQPEGTAEQSAAPTEQEPPGLAPADASDAAATSPNSSAEIADLVVGLTVGRPDAWAQLYRLTHLPLLRLITSLLGRSHDPRLPAQAEDLLQAVFVAAIESIERFDARKGTIDMWLVGIAKHKVKELRRSHQRESERFPTQGDPGSVAAADARASERAAMADRRGDGEAVLAALDQLEPRYAEVLRRKYLLHQSLAEIAQALGFTVSTVGIWLYRGRDKFRQAFLRVQHGGAPAQGSKTARPLSAPGTSPAPAPSLNPTGTAGGSVLHWPRPGEASG